MTFFYKHIVPTGLKIVTNYEVHLPTSCLCETLINIQLFGTTR